MPSPLVSGLAVVALAFASLGAGVAAAQTPWVAPDAEKAKKSPLSNDKKFVDQGAKLAQVNCAT